MSDCPSYDAWAAHRDGCRICYAWFAGVEGTRMCEIGRRLRASYQLWAGR